MNQYTIKFTSLCFIFTFLIFGIMSCKSTATAVEISYMKKAVSDENLIITATAALPVELMNVRGIENLLPFGSSTAYINLSNLDNHIKIVKDSLQLYMPYYGEHHISKGYGTSGGFEFKGTPEKKSIHFQAKDSSYLLEYWLDTEEENLRIAIRLFSNKKSRFTINSSNRTTISYQGTWKTLNK